MRASLAEPPKPIVSSEAEVLEDGSIYMPNGAW